METNNKQTFTGYQVFLIAVLALLQFTIVLDFMIISPIGDTLMKNLSISTAQFGIIVSSYAFSAGASGIFAAGFADKFDRKNLLVFFYAGFIVGTFFCGISNSYYTLLASRIITGLFGGVIGSVVMAIVTDEFQLNQRGRVMGFVQMAFAVSQILGIPVGIFIANHFGWHYTFQMIVAVALIAIVVISLKMKPVAGHLARKMDKNALTHLVHTIMNSKYQIGFMATTFLAVGGFMMMPFSAPFLINNIGITKEQLPAIFMVTGVASMVIMPIIGKLSDSMNKYTIFVSGSLLSALMVMIYVNLPVVPLWVVMIVNVTMFVGIMGRIVPATSLNTSIPEMQDRGAYMSINSSLQYISGGIGAILAGFIVNQKTKTSPIEHFDILGIVVSSVILITILLMYRVYKLSKA